MTSPEIEFQTYDDLGANQKWLSLSAVKVEGEELYSYVPEGAAAKPSDLRRVPRADAAPMSGQMQGR